MPLGEEIQTYFACEVLQQADTWIDHSKTVKGNEISLTRYFYHYVPPRGIEEITAGILRLEEDSSLHCKSDHLC